MARAIPRRLRASHDSTVKEQGSRTPGPATRGRHRFTLRYEGKALWLGTVEPPRTLPACGARCAAARQMIPMTTRTHNRLTTRKVEALDRPGRHADGGGLYLAVRDNGSKSWSFLYSLHGKRRELGLGSVRDVPLARARELAAEARQAITKGENPISPKHSKRSAGASSFAACCNATAFTHFGLSGLAMSDSLSWRDGGSGDGAFAGAVWRPPPGKRGAFLHARLVETGGRGVRVRRLGASRAGEIRLTRFLRNPAVTVEEMAAEAAARTAGRCAGRPVLAIQDTTVVTSEGGGGLYLHAVLAVDEDDGAILGLMHACFLARDAGRRSARGSRPLAEKESRRWLDGAGRAAEVGAKAARVTVIADRESDIFAAFALRPATTELLVRAAQDRSLGDGGRLFGRADALAEGGRARLRLPAKPGRPAREALVAVRFMAVELARPTDGVRTGLPKSVVLNLVDVREVDPPAGEGVHWRLLTTLPVADAAEAFAVADLYRRRWAIEQLFRTLKTKGFDIEAVRIGEDAARSKLTMAALVAAVTSQQLAHARDGGAGQSRLRPVTDAFGPDDLPLLEALCQSLEGKTERQRNPHPRGSLAYAAWVCARLGGWTGYYGKPGPIVMLQGWLEFQAAKRGAALMPPQRNV